MIAADAQYQSACGRLHHVAVDMHVMPKPFNQQPIHLAEGHSGLRHLELDFARSGIRKIAFLVRAERGVLQHPELVEQSAGRHHTVDAARHEHGRRVKGFDDDLTRNCPV